MTKVKSHVFSLSLSVGITVGIMYQQQQDVDDTIQQPQDEQTIFQSDTHFMQYIQSMITRMMQQVQSIQSVTEQQLIRTSSTKTAASGRVEVMVKVSNHGLKGGQQAKDATVWQTVYITI